MVAQHRTHKYAAALAVRLAGQAHRSEWVRVGIVRGKFDLDDCLLNRRIRGEDTVLASATVTSDGAALPLPTEACSAATASKRL